jgi:hypothetical protein
MDGADIWMIQSRRSPCFPPKPFQRLRIAGKSRESAKLKPLGFHFLAAFYFALALSFAHRALDLLRFSWCSCGHYGN